jgi:hypothetical protein
MKIRLAWLQIFLWTLVGVANAAETPAPSSVSARIFNSADISVAPSKGDEWKTLTFDSKRWDTAQLYDAANPGRLKTPVAGSYYIFANVIWESPIGRGIWGLRLLLNGKTVIAEQTTPNPELPFRTSMSVGTLYALAPGDYVEVQVLQISGALLFIRHVPATSPEFGIVRIP